MSVELERFDFRKVDEHLYVPAPKGTIVDLPDLRPSEEAVQSKIQEFGEEYRTVELPDRHRLSFSVVNADQWENGAKLVMATPNSGNEQNAGHVFEICSQAAVNPDQAILSVDPPRHLTMAERRSLIETGRFTYFDLQSGKYRGLPSIEAIGKVLSRLGYEPKYLSGNHAATHLEMAVAMGLPKNTIQGIFANGPHIAPGEHKRGDDEVEDFKGRARRHLDPDQWAPNTARQKQVRASLPAIYSGPGHKFNMARLWVYSALNDLLVYRSAFKHDDLDQPNSHATLQDAAVVLKHHESAIMTAQFKQGDRSQSREESLEFGELLANMINSPRIRLIFAPGSRDSHTDHPQARWEAEQWAFTH